MKPPKYESVRDLIAYTPAVGKSGCMLQGAPMDLLLSRFEADRALRTDHKLSCCECGFRHLMTYEVYTTKNSSLKGRKAYPIIWWLKVRAYGDDETRPISVKRSKLAPKPRPLR